MDCLKTGERQHADVTKGMMVDSIATGMRPGQIVTGYSRLSNIKERLNAKSSTSPGKSKDKDKDKIIPGRQPSS